MRLLFTAFVALALTGCPARQAQAPDAGDAQSVSQELPACEWVEALSGRFYMEPPSAWLDAKVVPLSSDQAHWWLDVQTPEDGCKAEGPALDISDALAAVRTNVLDELVGLELLPSESAYWATKRAGGEIHVFPRELYLEGVWVKMVEKNLAKRLKNTGTITGIWLRVEYRAKKTSTGQWWKDHETAITVGKANE